MRRPTVKPGELHVWYGRLDGDAPDVIFANGDGVPRCDRALLNYAFCSKRMAFDSTPGVRGYVFEPGFIEELEKRGYDLSTLRFRIRKKDPTR